MYKNIYSKHQEYTEDGLKSYCKCIDSFIITQAKKDPLETSGKMQH